MSNAKSYISTRELTIRQARVTDADAIRRLAELDSAAIPAGRVLLAELDGVAVAALSLSDRRSVADPFRPTEHLVQLLHEHARRPNAAPAAGARFAGGLKGRSAPWPA